MTAKEVRYELTLSDAELKQLLGVVAVILELIAKARDLYRSFASPIND